MKLMLIKNSLITDLPHKPRKDIRMKCDKITNISAAISINKQWETGMGETLGKTRLRERNWRHGEKTENLNEGTDAEIVVYITF